MAVIEGAKREAMSIPEVIRVLAQEKGWSIAELARRCSIPHDSMVNMAHGRSKHPRLDTLQKLAHGTGKSLADIAAMMEADAADNRAARTG